MAGSGDTYKKRYEPKAGNATGKPHNHADLRQVFSE